MTATNDSGYFTSAFSGTALSNFINNVMGSGAVQFVAVSTASGLTASGTNRATALALTSAINVISTVTSGTGVVLPSSASVGIGGQVLIFNNDSADAVQVYGAGSDTIDIIAGSTGVVLTHAKRCAYIVTAAGVWTSAQLGVVSA